MNCEQIDCPICFDCIGEKNNITTECGHKFHASCLMTNITRNGFGCPCCRTLMAEHPEEDDDATLLDDDRDYDDDDDDDDDESDPSDYSEDEPFSDDALRGLRLLTNLLEGADHDQEDVVAEHQYISQPREEDNVDDVPPHGVIVRSLKEQGVTYEHLLAWILIDHPEYEDYEEQLGRFSGDIWGKIRTIVSNYMPEEEAPPPVSPIVEAEAPAPVSPIVEAEAPAPVSPIVEAEDDWIKELASICCPESPIPVAKEEVYDIEFMEEYDFSFVEERRRRGLTISDLDDLCVDLSEYMIDYTAQPKMPLIHV